MIKVLTFTSLFPNSIQQRHGIFVRNRLEQLVKNGNVESIVVAPVPWFPFRNKIFGQYSQYARVPLSEEINGIKIFHPRYINIPKIGMNLSPWLMVVGVKRLLKKIRKDGYDFDL
ncbi:MAG TPA: glycosyltransferase family 4 protein, partial [Gammaproteobacteria bacterium]|nr:glycosyltransferase family 4 protein [Gammaproteobacteria bacterium]